MPSCDVSNDTTNPRAADMFASISDSFEAGITKAISILKLFMFIKNRHLQY